MGTKLKGDISTRFLIYLIPAFVFVLGLCFWVAPSSVLGLVLPLLENVPHDRVESAQVRELGTALLGGAVVAFAVLVVQVHFDQHMQRQERRRTEGSERLNLQLMLSLQRDLPNINLQGHDLRDFYFGDKNLSNANLSYTKLDRAILAKANLTRAQFVEANLVGADLMQANLTNAQLKKASLEAAHLAGTDFSGANLLDANMHFATLWLAVFANADLKGADMSKAQGVNANFSRADLRKANLSGASLMGSNTVPLCR